MKQPAFAVAKMPMLCVRDKHDGRISRTGSRMKLYHKFALKTSVILALFIYENAVRSPGLIRERLL